MLIKIKAAFLKKQPEMLLVFGDTSPTMTAALATVEVHIPVCHVEVGNRLGTLDNHNCLHYV